MKSAKGEETTSLRILVTGASGFIGQSLVRALTAAGHQVRAMTRDPNSYKGAGKPVAGDVNDPASLADPLAGTDIAYYLVHALGSSDFRKKDAAGARAFGQAAAAGGVRQIIYLGGLGGDGALSPHLRSRRDVEELLGAAGVSVTVLRAAVVVGPGGASWEMTRRLVERLPVMAVPSWATTRTQPIALADTVRYLAGVAGKRQALGQVFEIGGRDQLTYVDMLKEAALVIRGKPLPILVVPMFAVLAAPLSWLSSWWITAITGANRTLAWNLIESMSTEVIVSADAISAIVPGNPLSYDQAVRAAVGHVSATAPEVPAASSAPKEHES